MRVKVLETMKKWGMCKDGERIVVGLSGGADSVVLLHILKELAKTENWVICAVHVHHGLRGLEADRDCDFAKKLCEQWQIPLSVFHYDIKKEAKQRGLGEEETGRLLRYEAFAKVANGARIAVAHHQKDQAETVLMRLARGSGMKGLGGIRPVRGAIIRPLLYCSRADVEAYCEAHGLEFCEDSTNAENTYARNKMRNQILPLLEEMYPRAVSHIAKTAELFNEEENFLLEMANVLFEKSIIMKKHDTIALRCSTLSQAHFVLRKRVYFLSLQQIALEKDVSMVHLENIELLLQGETGRSIHLPNGVLVEKRYDEIVFTTAPIEGKSFEYPLYLGEETFIPEAEIYVKISLITKEIVKYQNEYCTKVFDYDKIGENIVCRTRKMGDRLIFSGGSKKLKDYFIDEKIPRDIRANIPLIAFENEVIWVVGKRVAEGYVPDEKTKRYLKVEIWRKQNERKSGSAH